MKKIIILILLIILTVVLTGCMAEISTITEGTVVDKAWTPSREVASYRTVGLTTFRDTYTVPQGFTVDIKGMDGSGHSGTRRISVSEEEYERISVGDYVRIISSEHDIGGTNE